MPSKTFQPLLFDSFKFRLPNSTYVDHYGKKYKKRAFSSLARTLSQREKMDILTKRARPFTSSNMHILENKYVQRKPYVYLKLSLFSYSFCYYCWWLLLLLVVAIFIRDEYFCFYHINCLYFLLKINKR
jgi:hypothetical protein